MEGRGKLGVAAVSTLQVQSNQRLEAPADLSDRQKELWLEIVATKPSEWFQSDMAPLLLALVRCITEYERQSRALEGLTPGQTEYRDLCKIVKDQANLMKQLMTSLRLTPQSRYTPQAAATANKNTPQSKPWEFRGRRT